MTRHAPPSDSLKARINDAERHLLEHQRSVRVQVTMLDHHLHEQLTCPALLGPAVGLGFLLGHRTEDSDSGRSWLRMAVTSMPWMRTLFTTKNPGTPTLHSSSYESSE